MSSDRYLKVVSKLGLAALALGSFAGAGNAQTAYRASSHCHLKFTGEAPLCLPVTTNLQLASQSSPYTLYIHGDKTNVIVRATCGRHWSSLQQCAIRSGGHLGRTYH